MAKDKKEAAPKLQANSAPTAITTHHAPTPRKKGSATAPKPSISGRIKKAWRNNGKGMSLKEYARKHEMGKDWLANKAA